MEPKIIVVEDELIIALDIKEILNQEGYDVVINIVNVDDAIKIIEDLNPNLVLIDINLRQDKDGIELGEYLLKKDLIPFIYVTSYTDKSTLERAAETRPYGYIVKPFKHSDLTSTITIALNNFKHRKIDVLRQKEDVTVDIPFILKQSINYINENINEKIKISDLAKQTRWESQHFNRLFSKYVGLTPYKYIIDKKIHKAKILLTETNIPITQISFELGFKSHSNFCSIFKKTNGKTPENYRKWYQVNSKYLK